jgi:hypothetical protein
MTTQKVFGRRNAPPPRGVSTRRQETSQENPPASQTAVEQTIESRFPPPDNMAVAQLDEELRQWRRTRRQAYKIPWRQLTLMASLCFGIAAFVLPETISSGLDWLLYGMMAAGFYAGLRARIS